MMHRQNRVRAGCLHRDGVTSKGRWMAGVTALSLAGAGGAAPPVQKTVEDGQTRTIHTWATKEHATSPVSFCFDWQGSMYIAETARAGNAVTDTRNIPQLNAVEEDLRMRSVEDRRAQIRRWVGAGKFPKDYFTKTEDRVRLVRDTDGDGVADTSTVFAGGFNDEVDGIGAGVLWQDGGLFYTCIPNLWALRDTKGAGVADERKSLASGFGVRWCFFGHDLHGLVAGPDGRVYFSMGDRGYNVVTREGKNLVGVDRGGVFRCWPDGSELELFFEGLRNPQELAFNEYGDLFTGDNNCDSGDRARIVQIVEGGDAGWRQDVQSLDSRGPWNREHMWELTSVASGASRPAWALPPVEYMGAGPSGLAFYPGVGDSRAYEGCFFLVDFYGSGSTVHSFRCVPEGAGFRVADHKEFYKGLTVTDIAWGYDGRFYCSDWGGGWQPNPNGSVFTITNETVREDAGEREAIAEVRETFRAGFAQRSGAALREMLAHRDSRVRLAAQYELAKRGPAQIGALGAMAGNATLARLQRVHAVWALGQLARKDPSASARVQGLLEDGDGEIRRQATRVLGDVRAPLGARYIALLEDPSARVRLHAAVALGRIAHEAAIGPLLGLLERNADRDLVLRHGAAYALALINRPERMMRTVSGMGSGARLGAAIALRRLRDPRIAAMLDDPDPEIVIEAARAVYDFRFRDELPKLAAMLDGPLGTALAIEPLMRRAIEANRLIGSAECARRLASFAARADADAAWRRLALERLATWPSALKREGVWGNWVDLPALPTRDLGEALSASIGDILRHAKGDAELLRLASSLDATYLAPEDEAALLRLVATGARGDAYRAAVLDRLARVSPGGLAAGAESVLGDGSGAGPELREHAIGLLPSAEPTRAVSILGGVISRGAEGERQRAVGALASMESPGARRLLSSMALRLQAGHLNPAIALEFYEAAAKQPEGDDVRSIAESAAKSERRPMGFTDALLERGGDPRKGREVFLHHEAAQCLRCHAVDGEGGTAGPSLTGIASRRSPKYLVESVVDPGASVAPGYGDSSSMPATTRVMTPREARDVIAYLETLESPGPGKKATAEREPDAAPVGNAGHAIAATALGLPLFVVIWRGVRRRAGDDAG